MVVQQALAAEGDAPGYPLTVGRPAVRDAVVRWLARVHGVKGLSPEQVLPVIGTKELIGSLALHLSLGPDDVIAHPTLAYPTYAVGAALVGARTVNVDGIDDLLALEPGDLPSLVWVNSPSNPTGRVIAAAELSRMVSWCRERSVLLVSDECYLDLGWDVAPTSVLHPDVCGGSLPEDRTGLLALHSLSKRSNLAGYRIGFVSGDLDLVAELASVRRNLGLQLPSPQQGAAIAALDDDEHVSVQRGRYLARREVLADALLAACFRLEHGEAGLYLWATRDEAADATIEWLADLGIVAVSGATYGEAGARHVRFALTAPLPDIHLAAERLIGATSAPADVPTTAPKDPS